MASSDPESRQGGQACLGLTGSSNISRITGKMSKYYQGRFPPSAGAGGRLLVVQGASYRSVPSGELTMGRDDNVDSLGKMVDRLLPHPVAVDSFYLGETEVTNRQFAAFVAQNPQWSPANTAAWSRTARRMTRTCPIG